VAGQERESQIFKIFPIPLILRLKTFVKINFANNRIIVLRRCLNLSALDSNNGVDVELMMGADTAVENIMMEYVSDRRLRYVRSN